MSGHSKWSNIKHRKEKTDSQKAKIFTKIGREISVAVKTAGPDPETNGKLKEICVKARSYNMPNENIMRCIKKASGEGNADNYTDITYEGYGPSGVAVIVETLTDNKNRTAGDMRHYFDKYGGNLGTSGSVMFMFEQKGIITISALDDNQDELDEEQAMLDALECGAEDFEASGELFIITTHPNELSEIADKLSQKFTIKSQDKEFIPTTTVKLTDPLDVKNMNKLIEMLEDNDDVQNVYHNWEMEIL